MLAISRPETPQYETRNRESSKGKREQVIRLARQFIQKYPDNKLAYNSKYLLAEIIYQKGQQAEALKLFNQVIDAKNSMAPFAMYMKAKLLANRGEKQAALKQLNVLVNYYTSSNVIPKAERLINKLGGQNE